MTLIAIGAYQLGEVLRASKRLAERDVPRIYLFELSNPAGFESPESKPNRNIWLPLKSGRNCFRKIFAQEC